MKIAYSVLMIATLTLHDAASADPQADPEQIDAWRAQVIETQRRLNLTDEQKEAVEPVLRTQFAATQAVLERYGIEPGAATGGKRNMRQMRAMAQELKSIRGRAEKDVEKILTREQMAEYRELQEARRAEMREQIMGR